LATEPSPQRVYRAACPNCGAPVEFRSAASAFAVCSFCKSTVVREGDALRKIGESADLFDDHTPLQLGAAGKYRGAAFTLVGRLQYRYSEGTWNEWHALFVSGDGAQKSGWLSEDNGRYVMAFDAPLEGGVPVAASLRAGAQVTVAGQVWSVASVSVAKLIAAQGELPYAPNLARGFVVSDLRNSRGEVGTLDYSDAARPRWSIGRSVAISELAMTGLAEAAEKTIKGRSLQCPNCGAALEVTLATTQSIVCHQCHSVIDLTSTAQQNVGGALQHYAQQQGSEPLIPLGSTGTINLGGKQALPWQVVGYAERCEVPEAGSDDEQTFWREYLLYHRTEGFAFIVDAQDGWSWTAPITGVPEGSGNVVKYEGGVYRKLYDYTGMVTYVLGEFYWQVTQNQRTFNTDYQGTGAASARRLNREETRDAPNAQTGAPDAQEVVWSCGEMLSAQAVMAAFKLAPEKSAALQRDALPNAFSAGLLAKIFFWVFIIIVVLLLFRCGSGGGSGSDCDSTRSTFGAASSEYQSCLNSNRSGGGFRTGGGAFGGFSSGGGHK
jgi:ribosomal protein L37AE/L43A